MDIGFIRDESNKMAQQRGPRVDVHPLVENFADMVEKDQGDDHATLEPTNTIPA